jgi:hypothetical protein
MTTNIPVLVFYVILSHESCASVVISKANRTLGFLRRNIYKCPQDIKAQAYISLVRPHFEYASSVWDPFRKCHINTLEMVQRKAARFATSSFTDSSRGEAVFLGIGRGA